MKATDLVLFANKIYEDRASYWYGTIAGQYASAALLADNRKRYPSAYTDERLEIYNADIRAKKPVTDCSGLIKGALMSQKGAFKYNSKYDLNDYGFYKTATESGPINTMPDIPGLLLWKTGHIGVYVGKGYVIEAVGFSRGVQRNLVAYRTFTHWLKSSLIEYDTLEKPVYKVYTVKAGDTLWKISREAHVCLHDLLIANPNITNPDLIFVGQKINIPIVG